MEGNYHFGVGDWQAQTFDGNSILIEFSTPGLIVRFVQSRVVDSISLASPISIEVL